MSTTDVRHEPLPQRPTSVAGAVGVIAPAVVLVIGMVAAVNLAIPNLQASGLHPSVSGTAWVVDSYTLVFACLLIPAGALGDRFGRKRGMLIGLATFAVGSAIAALAPSVGVLMAGRALSGVGAAFVLPATLAVALGRLEPPDRPRAVALWSALTGVGGAVGNLGGGIAVVEGGWRVLFWAGIPIALAAGALIASGVPDQPPHQDPVDGGGAALLTSGMVALLYGVIDAPQLGWGSWQVIGSIALSLLILSGFVVYELRLGHPMLDPRLFRLPGVRAGALGIIALFFALFGLFYVNAQYLQDVKGYSALITGVCVLPLAIALPVASARSTDIEARIGGRATIVLGMVTVAAGLALLSFATVGTPYALYGVFLALTGLGIGLALPPLSGTMVHALPPTHAGVSAGLNSTTRELGSAVGVAVFSTILTTRFADHLPLILRDIHGTAGSAIRHSITAALHAAAHTLAAHTLAGPPARAQLVHGTRAAFTSGTSLGLRVGAAVILLTIVVVALEHPSDQPAEPATMGPFKVGGQGSR